MNLNERFFRDVLQPHALGSFWNWIELLRENGRIEPKYYPRVLFVALSSALTSPLRLYQHLVYRPRFEETNIIHPPIFILGHWRSGTTHLHNLMTRDKQLGYVSALQAMAPGSFFVIGKAFKSFLRHFTPERRLMDNMEWSIDGPQEDEMGLANVSKYSLYHHWSFPRNARNYFKRYVVFEGTPNEEMQRWQDEYVMLVRRATYNMEGKQLVIKNPANTGRVRELLELFPDARFVNIVRDPYRVFLSTRHLYNRVLKFTKLQEISAEEIDQNILLFYREMMQKYIAEKEMIPSENFVEIKYEDLSQNPLGYLKNIYEHTRISDFSRAEPGLRRYLRSIRNYRTNTYDISPEDIDKVNKHWAFAFEHWGYEMRESSPTNKSEPAE
jgi:hypothetical protein